MASRKMETKKITLKMRDTIGALPRVAQIFSRRGWAFTKLDVSTLAGGFKEIVIEFPADEARYKTLLGLFGKLIDAVEVK